MQAPIINDNCTGCGRCVAACRAGALSLNTELPNGFGRKLAVFTPRRCSGCMDCLPACPHQALEEPVEEGQAC
jgi:ferredoxin